jgi:hypothetical protein
MDKQELVKKAYEALERDRQVPAKDRLQRLKDKGILDEQGNLRDKVHFWHAFLAVVAVKPGSNGKQLDHFRCLKPAFGLPGSATIDISRESLIQYLTENKRIITAYQDEKQTGWKEGEEIHLTASGYLRTDGNEDEQDNLGALPHVSTVCCGR